MFRKMACLTIIALILVGAALLISGKSHQAFAQEENPPVDSTCISCHEDQYYLHDTGNWYCLNETKVGCTECHRGHPDMRIKECAHEGLIAHPLANDAAVCQSCHPDDYRARVQIYTSIAGISPTPRRYATYTPSASIPQPGENADRMRLLQALPPGGWQVAGLSFLGVSFLVSCLFACHCWTIDHGA
jgi:hypothetical protein